MADNTAIGEISLNIPNSFPAEPAAMLPDAVLSDPALLFLYYRIEQILGIKAGSEVLKNLNKYIEDICKATFIENPATYEELLTSREHIFEISKFVTINETYFFREEVQFNLLANLLPQLAKLNRPLQICCAAVSIGCEAYSVAMLLDYYIKKGINIDFSIDAFDVDNEAIDIAKKARYTSNTIRSDGENLKYILDLYLNKENNEYIVCENIQKKVNFFPLNIMRGLKNKYDIIFFRNSLIYFSHKSRLTIINNLSEALNPGGLLFTGISETSSVIHPLLENRYSYDVFYFQKTNYEKILSEPLFAKSSDNQNNELINKNTFSSGKRTGSSSKKMSAEQGISTSRSKETLPNYPVYSRQTELQINCSEITDILKDEEGKPNADNIHSLILNEAKEEITGCKLAAAVIFFLHTPDFDKSDFVLKYLEKNNTETFTRFLRGEYYFLRGSANEAEMYYQEAAVKNKSFWPAFYRIAVLASGGNRTRYEYKIKKTIESIELSLKSGHGKELYYECFMGGFSPDYFLRILEKKLTEK